MLKTFRRMFPVARLDSKTTHNALVIAEHKRTGISRNQVGHLIFAAVFIGMSVAISLVPDRMIGGSDAALIRLLMLPACVLLAVRQMTKFWHDWRNILYIDKTNGALCHFQMNRRGVKSGMLRIPFDDVQKVKIIGAKTDETQTLSELAQLLVIYNREPGKLIALQGTASEIAIAQDLILQELNSQTTLTPATKKPRKKKTFFRKLRIMSLRALWSAKKLNPLA